MALYGIYVWHVRRLVTEYVNPHVFTKRFGRVTCEGRLPRDLLYGIVWHA